MCFDVPLPTWKQIFRHNIERLNATYYETISKNVYFLSESYSSISLILNTIRIAGNKEQVIVLVPDYFSKKDIPLFQETWVKAVYYPIGSDLNPKWDFIKEWAKENTFDTFIFSHYFGSYFGSICRAKEICKSSRALLIEDCSHVLYPTGKMGTNGDFVIYCPYKQLPVMDGEVLYLNNHTKELADCFFPQIQRQYDGLQEEADIIAWYMKKSLQKIVPKYGNLSCNACMYLGHNSIRNWKPHKISRASYHTLCDYTYIELKKIAYIRRDNLDTMNYIISRLFPGVTPLLSSKVDVPYVAAYMVDNAEDKRTITKRMMDMGFTLLQWEDPPSLFKGDEGQKQTNSIFENIILLPIHQDITPQILIKRYL